MSDPFAVVGIKPNGDLPDEVRARLAGNMADPSKPEGAALSTAVSEAVGGFDGLAGWGHSMMQDTGSTRGGWIMDLAADLGVPGFNGGESGTCSTQAGARQGGVQPLLTFPGNTIPAGTATTTVAVSPASSWRPNFGHGGVLVLADGSEIPGSLTVTDGPTFAFKRTSAGEAVAAGGPVRFRMKTGDSYRRWAQVLWIGVNNLLQSGARLLDAVPDTAAMARHQIGEQRVLILADIPTTTQGIGTTAYAELRREYDALVTMWGAAHVIDVNAELVARGLELAGINATATDKANIAAGVAPDSLRSDGFHPNQIGYAVIRKIARQRIRELGWFPSGGRPIDNPAQPTALAATTVTLNSQSLTWGAVAGADGYRVEHRVAGAASWSRGSVSATPAATVHGLLPGTSYDYRVIAFNAAGASAPSTPVTASTGDTAPTLLFSDSFSRADGALANSTADATLGGSSFVWGAQAGARVVGGQVGRTTVDTTVRYGPGPNVGAREMRVEIVVPVSAGDANGFGPMLAYLDATSYAYAYITSDGSITIGSRVGNQNGPQSGSAAGVFAAGDRVAVSLVGDTVRAYVNDVEVVSRDVAGLTGTIAGLRLTTPNTWRGDNFKVYNK